MIVSTEGDFEKRLFVREAAAAAAAAAAAELEPSIEKGATKGQA